ncbi:pyridoxamine 5'-phosphate oxidase family protein [Candidatus Nitrosocosmicus franklandus]|uniref:Pyridoxamine 5'-phosphate oxidase n=1 Tax=Candidatus Nitrosocosmicus franklandianus TaxID=1798806 RepID=A0A484IJF3_9ARCH|nr:pyridoxamine 5'-phosphate oxidase family protein [Candidatus Nitrosocosmicus franklandus]VFJ15018.1 Pyridoxamine 5'-phosphate oxidase [Candidatus Nitrosocosmicus franklandus]
MVHFTPKELEFIKDNECCRLATSSDDKPHVVPVSYLFHADQFYIATDYNTKKFSNIKKNPNISLVIDVYKQNGNRGLTLQGVARIYEQGPIFADIYSRFYQKFEWVRNDPWKEYEAPIIEITVISKSSWGIN